MRRMYCDPIVVAAGLIADLVGLCIESLLITFIINQPLYQNRCCEIA